MRARDSHCERSEVLRGCWCNPCLLVLGVAWTGVGSLGGSGTVRFVTGDLHVGSGEAVEF